MSLKRQTLWNILPLIVVTVFSLASVPVFYRSLGPSKYGMWMYIMTLTATFGYMDLGLSAATARFMGVSLGRRDHAAAREYWATGHLCTLVLVAGMALVFITAAATMGPWWFSVAANEKSLLRACVIVAGIGLFWSYYNSAWQALAQCFLDFAYVARLKTGLFLMQIIPAMGIAWLSHDLFLTMAWSLITAPLECLFLTRHARRSYGIGPDTRLATWKRLSEMTSYIIKGTAALGLGAVFSSIDRVVLGRFIPPAEFSHYGIATNAGLRLQSAGTAVMGPVFINTSRSLDPSSTMTPADIFNQMFDFVLGWYSLAIACAVVWGPTLLTLWLGPDIACHVIPLFTPLMVAFGINGMANISSAQMGPMNRMGTAAIFAASTGILTVLSVLAGWHLDGVRGVAWGYLASRIGILCQDIYVIRLIQGRGWLSWTTWRHVFIQTAIALAFYVVSRQTTGSSLAMPLALLSLHGLGVSLWLLSREGMLQRFRLLLYSKLGFIGKT